jgi:hypothetical protein
MQALFDFIRQPEQVKHLADANLPVVILLGGFLYGVEAGAKTGAREVLPHEPLADRRENRSLPPSELIFLSEIADEQTQLEQLGFNFHYQGRG